jgi:hypothetical protein
MATDIRTTSLPPAALGPSTGRTRGSRGVPATVTVRSTLLADLRDEITSLTCERDAIRTELIALRNLLTYAFGVEGWHIVLGVRDRLTTLSTSLGRRAL